MQAAERLTGLEVEGPPDTATLSRELDATHEALIPVSQLLARLGAGNREPSETIAKHVRVALGLA